MFLIWVYLMFPRGGIPAGILHKRCGILRRATDLKTLGAHLLSLALPQAAWWSAWHCSRPLPCIAMSEEQHLFFRSNRPSCLSLPPIGSTYCGAFFRAIQLLCQPLHMQPICGETRSSLLGQTAANIEEKCFFIPLVKTARQPLSNPRHLLSRSDPSTARGSHLKYHHQIAHLRCLATQSQPQLHNKSEASTATQNSVSKENKITCPSLYAPKWRQHISRSLRISLVAFSLSVPSQTPWPTLKDAWVLGSAKPLTSILSTWPPSHLRNSIHSEAHSLAPFVPKASPAHMPAMYLPPTWNIDSDTIKNSFPEQTSSYFLPPHLSFSLSRLLDRSRYFIIVCDVSLMFYLHVLWPVSLNILPIDIFTKISFKPNRIHNIA